MSTSNWMTECWQTTRQLWAAIQRILRFIYGNWQQAALVGEVYIVVRANEAGKLVCSEINDERKGRGHHAYFFWLALGIVVACANNLVIAGLATFKKVYLKVNREKKTRWLWPLIAAYICMMGLMSGILPAALRSQDGPSLFAIVSILSIYSQSVLWAIILGWRDVDKSYKGPSPTPPAPHPPPTTVETQAPTVPPPPTTVAAQSSTLPPPQQQPSKFIPLL